jgi:nitrite reductase/ring-hydroxylating ferredoxin subunit
MSSTSTTTDRDLGADADLPEAYVNPYYLEDLKHRVSIARVGGNLYAFDDLCTCGQEHQCPLSAGRLDGTTIMCQCHGSLFDITSGAVVRGPATKALGTYPVRAQDGRLLVQVAG